MAHTPGLLIISQAFRTAISKLLEALRVTTVELMKTVVVGWQNGGLVAAPAIEAGTAGFVESALDVREVSCDGHMAVYVLSTDNMCYSRTVSISRHAWPNLRMNHTGAVLVVPIIQVARHHLLLPSPCTPRGLVPSGSPCRHLPRDSTHKCGLSEALRQLVSQSGVRYSSMRSSAHFEPSRIAVSRLSGNLAQNGGLCDRAPSVSARGYWGHARDPIVTLEDICHRHGYMSVSEILRSRVSDSSSGFRGIRGLVCLLPWTDPAR